MSKSSTFTSGIAGRYATALFELAREAKAFDVLDRNLDDLSAALKASPDLADVIASPVYSREDQERAITTVAQKMGLHPLVTNTLSLMAQKRRLFVLPHLIAGVKALLAEERGEVTAEVRSAKALTRAQSAELAKTLKARVGKDIVIHETVDEGLIGGLVVKVGSVMIDSSIRAKLNALQNAMKEVG